MNGGTLEVDGVISNTSSVTVNSTGILTGVGTVDGRLGSGNGQAMGLAPDEQASLPPDIALAYASILKKAPPQPTFDQRWTAWAAAYGGSNSANGNAAAGSSNVTANTFGFAPRQMVRMTCIFSWHRNARPNNNARDGLPAF